MAKQRHLSKAPITEALINIQVMLPIHKRTIEHLAALDEKFREQYPDKKTIEEFQYKFEGGLPSTGQSSSKQLGFRYTNGDNTQVIQATISGLTFSRLPPYEDWPKLRAEARRVWKIYADIIQPDGITRVAARYINKLELPGPLLDFDDYLNYVPVVPKALPQMYAGFYSRIVVPDTKHQCMAIITQMYQPGQDPFAVSVVLDIDVFREKHFGDEQEAWATIDHLRDFKNLVFFDSLTEKSAELYQ
ncbi:MAG: TIGR04255 family protein [Nitrospirales bacterium]|nr:TIGR04255 family protein [Nitrospirales bacterium]